MIRRRFLFRRCGFSFFHGMFYLIPTGIEFYFLQDGITKSFDRTTVLAHQDPSLLCIRLFLLWRFLNRRLISFAYPSLLCFPSSLFLFAVKLTTTIGRLRTASIAMSAKNAVGLTGAFVLPKPHFLATRTTVTMTIATRTDKTARKASFHVFEVSAAVHFEV